MLQAVNRASKALQLQALPRLVSQISPISLRTAQPPSQLPAHSISQSAVALDRPTSAQGYTEEQIAAIRQRVFGTHIGDGFPSGRKILRKKLMGAKIASYYDHAEPLKDPLITNLDAERYYTDAKSHESMHGVMTMHQWLLDLSEVALAKCVWICAGVVCSWLL